MSRGASWWWLRLPALAVAGTLTLGAAGVRPNWTPSLPVGLYLVRTRPASWTPARDDIVRVCPPRAAAALALARGYLAPGACPSGTVPLLKPVAAVAGDTVTVTAEDVRVNGRRVASGPLARDSQGRPLVAMAPSAYPVAPGTVWLLSTYNAASFDSRYYGPVPTSLIDGTARPLIVSN